MAATDARSSSRTRLDLADIVLIAVGVPQILLGVLALVAPGAFYENVGPFPPENTHFIKDIGSWQVALGAAALYAVRRPAWRTPMLGLLALQFILHTISHVVDVGEADPDSYGPLTLGTTALGAVVCTAAFLRERRR